MVLDEWRRQLQDARSTLVRLEGEARSGKFTVGDEPATRTPVNMDAQVARIRHAIDDIDAALAEMDKG